ncbi:MAG: pitrilysin family protein [Nanoarchaeota archaeon]
MKTKFYRKVLKNGMTVILEKRETSVVSVVFAVKCGGMNETVGEKGISHFVEHLLYKGTLTRNQQQIGLEIEKNGGVINGFTDEGLTAFWCKMPSNKLSLSLEVLGDMVTNPLFDQKEIDKERKVIFEEIKMYKDNPTHYAYHRLQGLMYEKPFGIPIIGSEETLNSISREKILSRFNETYSPKNMILCVVGDADFDYLCSFAEKNFKKRDAKVPSLKIKKKFQSKIETRKGVDQANILFAYPSPLAQDKKKYAAMVLNALMAEGMSSRLFNEIRTKRNLAYSVSGHYSIENEFSHTIIYVGAKKENIEGIKNIILEEFKKIPKELNEKELSQVKDQVIGNHKIFIEDSLNQMMKLLAHESEGNSKELYNFEKNIKAVKLEDVKDLAKIKKYSFFALVPE